ncbi:MAG: peptidylprolyl isomerase [Crocinitomicaceae bacterium]
MAIIGKIRDKSWLILIIVGGALVAFILGDYQKGSTGTEEKYGYGTVYGEKVDMQAFNDAVAIADENSRRAAQQQQQAPKPVDKAQVWASFVDNMLLEKEFNELGLTVSDDEFDAYLYGREGFDVIPELAQGFTDSVTGMFNEKLLQARIEEMESSDDPAVQKQWSDSKEYYITRRKQEKYFAILNQGMYVTDLEAKNEYVAQKEIKSVSYVMQRFNSIKDEDIDVTDAKLKAYFDEHKADKKYENKTSTREVKFFDVTIEASKEDVQEFDQKLEELKKGLANATNDSLYVVQNSEVRFFSSVVTFKSDKDEKARNGMTYPSYMDTVIKAASIGDVVGPYEDNGSMKIAKVIGFNGNLLSARHILIGAQRTDADAVAKAKAKLDSIMPLINQGNFEEFVTKFSDDPGSKNTGGKYEDFMDYEMVPEFSKFATEEPIGKIGYVQTDFGFHIMETLDRKSAKEPVLAVIQKTLKPSINTIDSKEQEVYDLLYKLDEKLGTKNDAAAKIELFDTIVSQAGYVSRPINIQENSPKIYGFTSKFAEDKILQLAFDEDSKVGDLVSSPIKDKERYVIAVLSSVKNKGEAKFEDVKLAIKKDYIQDEKAKKMIASMKNAKSLSTLAGKIDGANVQKAEVTFGNPQITGAGYEPEIVGAIFSGLKDGQITVPLIGKNGVYVAQVEKTVKAPEAANYMVEKNQLLSTARNNVQGATRKALAKQADVVDNRRFYETNVRR